MFRPLLSLLAAATFAGVTSAQTLIMTNATLDTLCAFSPVDGSLISNGLFAIPNTVQVSAIEVNGEIWVSEQTGDRVVRYDSAGNQLGVIGPSFPTGGLDNIRGMAFIAGLVYVTNSGSANGATANSIVALDAAGNHVFTIAATGLANSPFGVMEFQGNLLVSGSSNLDDVHKFDLIGSDLGTFHNSASISFAHQIAPASDGNVWCAGFTTGGISKLDATTGNVISSFPAAGARGVFELLNGNIMWTNGTGAWVYDVATQTSTQVLAGSSYHLNLFNGSFGTQASAIPFGTGCDGLTMNAFGAPQLGNAGFALSVDNLSAISPIGFVGFGTVAFDPGIDLTFLGMAGCASYQNLDLNLYAGGPNIAGTSIFSLPIPNNPQLMGGTLEAQGLGFSTATVFGFASSNGMHLVLGN